MDLATARSHARRTGRSRVYDRDYYALEGGNNLVDPPLRTPPGELLGSLNYEARTRGGYRSVAGYERIDGTLNPSHAQYWILNFDAGVPAYYPAVGQTIAGSTSLDGGVVLAVVIDATGLAGYVVLARVTTVFPFFQDNENLTVGGHVFGMAIGTALLNNAISDDLDIAYRALAVEDRRALIAKVPGQGSILGAAIYRGVVYAWRQLAGSTNVGMYKATSGSWVQINFGYKIRFGTGSVEILPGDTITDATSGATASVRRVVLQSGSWSGGTAAGYVIVPSVTGTWGTAHNITVGGVLRAHTTSGAIAQTMAAGGRCEFRVHNFYGNVSTLRLYGVDGVNLGFEYQDGTGEFFNQIETGSAVDTPRFLAVHKAYLWYAFPGGSIQHSGVNDPAVWSVLTGAAEIAIGDEPTGFLEEVGDTLFVFARNTTQYISGMSTADFSLQNFNIETGAFPYSILRIGQGTYVDDRGVTTLTTTNKFGNYIGNSISEKITPYIQDTKLRITASCISKNNNIARIFYDDGRFLSMTFRSGKAVSFMPCDYGKPVRCCFSGEDATGAELIVFGSDDGYVYQADSGTSFDGAAISCFLRLPFNHNKSPSRIKRYREAEFDISAEGNCALSIGVDYSYARPDVVSDPMRLFNVSAGGGFWNISIWDQFRWSTGFTGLAPMKLEGSGSNVGFLISSASALQPQHSVNGVALRFSVRRMDRRSI